MRQFGHEIKRLRVKANISLREFARELGHSAAFQSDIEHGRRFPSESVLQKMVKRLGSAEANARLIAAAPELLAALVALQNTEFETVDEFYLITQAAIDKATKPC